MVPSWVGGSYLRGPGRQGKLLITRAVGKSNQELTFACDSMNCYLGYSLVSVRSLQASCTNKMDAEAASLAKLLAPSDVSKI